MGTRNSCGHFTPGNLPIHCLSLVASVDWVRDHRTRNVQRTRAIPAHNALRPPGHRRVAGGPPNPVTVSEPEEVPTPIIRTIPPHDGFIPPNVTFGAAAEPSDRVHSLSRSRRYVSTLALATLATAGIAVGSGAATGGEVTAYTDRIRSAVLSMVDDAALEPTTAEINCHPAYVDCVPLDIIEELDCEDLAITDVRLQDPGWDPYGLDDNGDGVGCEGS